MIPSLSPLSPITSSVRRSDGAPSGFRRLNGVVSRVEIRPSDYRRALGRTGAQRNGLRYEERVQRALVEKFDDQYWPAPYIHFRDFGRDRTCIPDGILTHDGRKFVFEIKISHTALAWWQLERLYRPLVQQYYHDRSIWVCEIVRSFDPAVVFPVEPTVIHEVEELFDLPATEFGVLVWKPQRT